MKWKHLPIVALAAMALAAWSLPAHAGWTAGNVGWEEGGTFDDDPNQAIYASGGAGTTKDVAAFLSVSGDVGEWEAAITRVAYRVYTYSGSGPGHECELSLSVDAPSANFWARYEASGAGDPVVASAWGRCSPQNPFNVGDQIDPAGSAEAGFMEGTVHQQLLGASYPTKTFSGTTTARVELHAKVQGTFPSLGSGEAEPLASATFPTP